MIWFGLWLEPLAGKYILTGKMVEMKFFLIPRSHGTTAGFQVAWRESVCSSTKGCHPLLAMYRRNVPVCADIVGQTSWPAMCQRNGPVTILLGLSDFLHLAGFGV